jgi:hypothetical protein
MAEKRPEVAMLYSHDRLGDEKLAQIYRMLVPEKIWKNEVADEDSGTLRTGLVGAAERRADDRESDASAEGICKGQRLYGGARVAIPGRRL